MFIYSREEGNLKVKIGEHEVPLPKKPADHLILNYGLDIVDQKFKKTEVPKELQKFKNSLNFQEVQFIENEWHKRKHGIWMFIKGHPIYIPGTYYVFLNYWILKSGKTPEFRLSQWKIFMIWDYVVRNSKVLGLVLFKPRRIGATELTIFLLWEKTSRTRGIHTGMQSKTKDTAEESYAKLVKSHNSMIWFFKPINRGSTFSKDALSFSYPENKITKNSLEKSQEDEFVADYTDPELSSHIDYESSTSLAYDGSTLARYTLNEFGKIPKRTDMDPITCWNIVRPTMELDAGQTIRGKALFESSIEQIGDDDDNNLDICNRMWDEANTEKLNDNGMTTNGMIRLLINALEAFKSDEWGFPDEQATKRHIENTIEHLKKSNKTKEIADFKRKFPLTIEDVLKPSGNQTSFNATNLKNALDTIDEFNNDGRPSCRRVDLYWIKKDEEVGLAYKENGRWIISQDVQPGMHPANSYTIVNGFRTPLNGVYYGMGVDPYDQKDTLSYLRSSGGCVITRKLDSGLDAQHLDTDGDPLNFGLGMKTNQPILTYLNRPDDPAYFYEDMIMTCFYYSTSMLYENNLKAIKTYFVNRGYANYLQKRPISTMTVNSMRQLEPGIPATAETVNLYFELLTSYIERFYNCIKHPELIYDALETSMKNRQFHDLTVAWGWSLVACMGNYTYTKIVSQEDTKKEIFDLYDVNDLY